MITHISRVRTMAHSLRSIDQGADIIHGHALCDAAPVRQVQLVQRSLEEIDVKLVAARMLTSAEQDRLRGAIGESLSHPFTLNLVYVDAISRSAGGKYEDFRSEIEI